MGGEGGRRRSFVRLKLRNGAGRVLGACQARVALARLLSGRPRGQCTLRTVTESRAGWFLGVRMCGGFGGMPKRCKGGVSGRFLGYCVAFRPSDECAVWRVWVFSVRCIIFHWGELGKPSENLCMLRAMLLWDDR
mgnify:CR=1 FL=1